MRIWDGLGGKHSQLTRPGSGSGSGYGYEYGPTVVKCCITVRSVRGTHGNWSCDELEGLIPKDLGLRMQ
jgi:hypothetical protein